MDNRITLKPVYSQTAPTPKGLKLPEDWLLSWHQIATLEALRDRTINVVFNTAMTGDGKSLAAYLQVLLGDCFAIGLYPTNELARDQQTGKFRFSKVLKFGNPETVGLWKLTKS